MLEKLHSAAVTPVAPGTISPRRPVPDAHRAPGVRRQAGARAVHRERGQGRRDHRADAGRRPARRPGAAARSGAHVAPGVTTDELDRIGHEFLCDHGAYPSTLGYKGFPKSLCTSVNEVICHGIPDSRVVEDGDIVNIDITAYLDGVHGDTNATFLAGDVDEECAAAGRAHPGGAAPGDQGGASPGRRINVIGRVIESYARRFGYGVVREFTGHGIGTVVPLGPGHPALRRPALRHA